jgi:hypothetical protein
VIIAPLYFLDEKEVAVSHGSDSTITHVTEVNCLRRMSELLVFLEIGVEFENVLIVIDEFEQFFGCPLNIFYNAFGSKSILDVHFVNFAQFVGFDFSVGNPGLVFLVLFHDGCVLVCNGNQLFIADDVFHLDCQKIIYNRIFSW